MKIEWRVIECAPQYEVSNTGLIRRIDTQNLRKIQTNKKGYQQISLNKKIYSLLDKSNEVDEDEESS